MTNKLTARDVEVLLAKPSGDARAEIAAKVAGQFAADVLNPRERQIAEEILRSMVKDAETRVRQALATSLMHTAEVPHDVAVALARDIETIAIPFVEASPALTDNDLIELVRTSEGTKQNAIARRPRISAVVADALVATENADVVRTLVRNPGAGLTEAALNSILDRHGKDGAITESMTLRAQLPLGIAERLVTHVAEHLRTHLVIHHKVPRHVAERLAVQSRERATVDLLNEARDASNISALVQQLRARGRLTPSLILRAACTGDIRFCEEAFAQAARLPVHKAWVLLHDAGPLGLRALYDRAGLPEVLYPAFRVALDVFHETQFDGGEHDHERFERRMLERVLTQYEGLAADDLDYLLDRLGSLTDDKALEAVAV
jgi:uncharacterized protein (DUF2336 family)